MRKPVKIGAPANRDAFLPNVRIEQRMYDDLKALAHRNERTIAAELRVAIRDHLQRRAA